MQFADALASSIHDIKNSLSLVHNKLDEILNDPATQLGDPRQAYVLQLEAIRANHSLIQLLSLYKLEGEQWSADILEHDVEDLLDDVLAENTRLMNALDIRIEAECEPYTSGYFDEQLVRNVLNSVLGNAQRYTKQRILLSATNEDGYLVLRVEDDGTGFPSAMLTGDNNATEQSAERTQLGLYFAAQVAALHRDGERRGRIRLLNGHQLPGGCFELWLP